MLYKDKLKQIRQGAQPPRPKPYIDKLSDTNLADWFETFQKDGKLEKLGCLFVVHMIGTVYDTNWEGYTPQEREIVMKFLNDFRVFALNV